MKLIKNYNGTLWSVAAQAGLFLSLVTIVCSTTSSLIGNSFLSIVLWIFKLTGSLWLLRYFMHGWGQAHKGESTFSFGCTLCFCSALICALFSFVLYKFIVPESLNSAFEMLESNLASMPELPEDVMDSIFRIEDNYPQISGMIMLFWCSLLGVIFSAIFKNSTSGGNKIFTEDELNENKE